MAKKGMTTDEILSEIEALKGSPYVKLAKKSENDMLRQKLYQLRSLDKKGRAITQALELNLDKEV